MCDVGQVEDRVAALGVWHNLPLNAKKMNGLAQLFNPVNSIIIVMAEPATKQKENIFTTKKILFFFFTVSKFVKVVQYKGEWVGDCCLTTSK